VHHVPANIFSNIFSVAVLFRWDGEEPKEESDTNANEKDQEDPSPISSPLFKVMVVVVQ